MTHWLGSFESLISSSLALAPPATTQAQAPRSTNEMISSASSPPLRWFSSACPRSGSGRSRIEPERRSVNFAMLCHFSLHPQAPRGARTGEVVHVGSCRGTFCSHRQRESIHFGCSASHPRHIVDHASGKPAATDPRLAAARCKRTARIEGRRRAQAQSLDIPQRIMAGTALADACCPWQADRAGGMK